MRLFKHITRLPKRQSDRIHEIIYRLQIPARMSWAKILPRMRRAGGDVLRSPGEGLLYPPLTPGSSGLAKQSFALIDHLRSIDKRRIRHVFGELARQEMATLDEGLALLLGLGGRLHPPDSPGYSGRRVRAGGRRAAIPQTREQTGVNTVRAAGGHAARKPVDRRRHLVQ